MGLSDTASKKNVAVMFGGRSVEHEISIITALQLIGAMDITRFRPIPVYIDPRGRWFTGDALLSREFYRDLPRSLDPLAEVVLLPSPGVGGLSLRKQNLGILSCLGLAKQEQVIPVDVFFLSFHGKHGEDGCLQGLMELANVCYTGCDVLCSALVMDKYKCKVMLKEHGIPVLPCVVVQKDELPRGLDEIRRRILSTPGLEDFPLFVKPCHLGSSIAVARAQDEAALDAALVNVFRYDEEALVEPCLTDLFEINVSVLEGVGEPIASVVEIPKTATGLLTYEEKYLKGGGKKSAKVASQGMADLSREIDPPHLDERYKKAVTEYAKGGFSILGCAGVVRFDFLVNKKTGELFFNELNPLPGSMAFYLWEKSQPPRLYTQLITEVIEAAERRHLKRTSLELNIGFQALFR